MDATNGPILVTGAAGFIGSRVVEGLASHARGPLRLFVRPRSRAQPPGRSSSASPLPGDAEVVAGDLTSREDCRRAARDVSIILHLAAGIDKSFAGAFMNSALATRNLIEAFLEVGKPVRFVNVSSFAVYSNRSLPRHALLDESCPLEDDPQARYDAYGYGKLKQDEVVREYGTRCGLPYVILRPGSVFGPGKKGLTGRVGIDSFGFFAHVGGRNRIPLTYVDNCADAIVRAAFAPGIEREVFNVVDDDLPTSAELLRAYRSKVRIRSIRVPYWVAYRLCAWWEDYSVRSQGQLPPVYNRRRASAEWKGNTYSNARLKERLGWSPRVPMREAIARYLAQYDAPVQA